MSTYWSTNGVDDETLARLGPYIDGFVGTDGEYQDLYYAVMTAGWKRIIVTPGCTMSANLTLSVNDGFIWSMDNSYIVTINSNVRTLTISGARWHLKGFRLNTPAGDGITVTGTQVHIENVGVYSATGRGLFLNGGDYHTINNGCILMSNADDGLEISSGVDYCRIHGNHISGNGAWGIDDNSNTMIEGGNYLKGNTSGARSTSSTTIDGKSAT